MGKTGKPAPHDSRHLINSRLLSHGGWLRSACCLGCPPKTSALCTAPRFIDEELLRADGVTEIKTVDIQNADLSPALGAGTIDFAVTYASLLRPGSITGRR